MDSKEYLQQVQDSDLMIKDKMEELADLEILATLLGSLGKGERVQNSGSQDKMAETVCKIVDLKKEIQTEIDNLLKLKREIRNIINRVSEPLLMSILHKRYLQYKSWEEISVELSISYRHTTRLHRLALQNVEKILNMS